VGATILIGININNQLPAALEPIAVSMQQVLGEEVDLTLAAARLIAKLTWNLGLLYDEEERLLGLERDDPEANHGNRLLAKWHQLSDTVGRRVCFGFDLQQQLPHYEAEAIGLDRQGFLMLRELTTGTVMVESSGEISYLK